MSIISDASILANPIAAEAELEALYLGSDMEAICDAAIASCDKVLIANSALPLENRRIAFTHWRKKAFSNWLTKDREFQLYYSSSSPETQEAINNGTASLAAVAVSVSALREAMENRRSMARQQAKERLREQVLSHLRDCDGTEPRLIVPQFGAILESGELGLFRRRDACIKWVKESGGSYLFFGIALGSDMARYMTPEDS